jgi:gas vesicle protein
METTIQQEDLQLLVHILQERLLAEIPFCPIFQVKCTVKNDELMILTQHPPDVTVDKQKIFSVLEEALQWQPSYQKHKVQFFLRILGNKLPYAQHNLSPLPEAARDNDVPKQESVVRTEIQELDDQDDNDVPKQESVVRTEIQELDDQDDTEPRDAFVYPTTDSPRSEIILTDEIEEEEAFDPLAGTPDLLVSKRRFLRREMLIGIAVLGSLVVAGSSYLLTRPCAISECQEIRTAEQLKTQFGQLARSAKSDKDLLRVEEQLDTAITGLGEVPQWSSYSQKAGELSSNLSGQSEKIQLVVKTLHSASSLVQQKTQTAAKDLAELKARENLWQKTIAPLEQIKPNSELYGFVQANLSSYRLSLQQVTQQLLQEEQWLKKLTLAKFLAREATKKEATAATSNDWQQLESNWQSVVNTLKSIPQSSIGYQEAQTLLADYEPDLITARDRATREQLAARTYQQALSTANQAQVYSKHNQLQAAVVSWDQALQAAKQVSSDSLYYNKAQLLIGQYSSALKHTQEQLQIADRRRQAHLDLEKTCTNGGTQFCTFTINNQGITVHLTPEYDQALQSSLINPSSPAPNGIDIKTHYENLRQALAVISDNTNLPLVLYDSSSNKMYTRTPEG